MNHRPTLAPQFKRIALVAACAVLTACGGGGNDSGAATTASSPATETTPGEFQLNPASTWRPPAADDTRRVGDIAAVALSRIAGATGSLAGRTLVATALGTYSYGTTAGSTAQGASALFVDANGAVLQAASGTTASPASKQSGCSSAAGADPFVGDLVIPINSVELVVPAGAVALWLSVDDCFFADNAQTADPARVRLVLKPAT